MKKFILFARVGLLFTLVSIRPAFGAYHQSPPPEYPNYVVIGAFAIEKNAAKFTQQANAANHHAKFDINPNRNLFYVYVLTTASHEEAIAEALRLRRETKYADAWVYQGVIGKDNPAVVGKDINPLSQEQITEVKTNQPLDIPVTETKADSTDAVEVTSATPPDKPKLSEEKLSGDELSERNFVFNVYRATDGEVVEGEIDAIDTEKSRKMATYKGNLPVKVAVPSGKSGSVSFVCQAFGYRKLQREFSFKSSEQQNVTLDENGNIVIPFELVRLQKGDISVMYNVFFFKDAAIMRPESRFEVNALLEMLKDNPNYKIKIHGHTNGNSSGKIITMGEQKNFFSLTGGRDGFGSAKKLSEERAAAIKEYLQSNGIEADRLFIKAWGGKRPIHDKHATRAHENVRVEVEILGD